MFALYIFLTFFLQNYNDLSKWQEVPVLCPLGESYLFQNKRGKDFKNKGKPHHSVT